ncbi:hypothetical protein O0L34_g8499 [Tuta absoluta]|nr:hypothetical protein O0L34_g8499 [Tuta absoluta]
MMSLALLAIISRAGRVPAHESAFCSRVTGPGKHAKHHYQITCEQALAAVCAKAELESLASWASEVEAHIERPLRDYAHFVDACFGPFSVQIAKTGAYKQLEKECSELTSSLREKVSVRRRELALGLTDSVRQRIRMTTHDLRQAVQASALELSKQWYTPARREEWWAARGLGRGDWHALAANTLVEVFDAEILVALEENSACLPLDSGEGVRQWAQRCVRVRERDHEPPDVLERGDWPHKSGVWGEWGGTPAPRVPLPSLEASAFSPRAPHHPPVPHPAIVALVLHNRDSDNPVPLESELCADILRSLEDAPDSEDRRENIERYRGGGSEESSTAGSSASTPDDDTSSRQTVDPDVEDVGRTQVCRVSPIRERAACRWTLTGRGVRLRADLASPEDVSVDLPAQRHVGTSV